MLLTLPWPSPGRPAHETSHFGVMYWRWSLRYNEQRIKNVTVKKDKPLILKKIKGEHLELKVVVKEPGADNYGLDVLCDEQGKNGLRINFNRKS